MINQRESQTNSLFNRKEHRWIDSFIAISMDSLIAVDSKMRISFINPSAAKFFDGAPAELIGTPLQDIPNYGPIMIPPILRALESRKGIREEHEFPGEKATIVEATYSPVVKEDEKASGVFCILRDITKRHSLAQELAESNRRIQTQTKALDVFNIISESDLSGNIVYANDAFCEVSQYSKEELMGENYRLLNSGHHSRDFFKQMWKQISQGEPWYGDIKNSAKDGTSFWVRTIIAPIFHTDGKLRRFLTLQLDITEKQQIYEASENFFLRFRQILENSPDIVLSLDLEGNITYANHSFLELTGLNPSQIRGQNWLNRFIQSDKKIEIQRQLLSILTNETRSTRLEASLRNEQDDIHSIKDIVWLVYPLVKEENIIGLSLVGEDVTLARARQSELKHLRQESDRRQESIFSFVSHQLKSGLTSVEAGLKSVIDEFSQSDPNQNFVKETSEKILKRIQELDKLSVGLLNNLRKNNENIQLQIKPISIKSLVKSV